VLKSRINDAMSKGGAEPDTAAAQPEMGSSNPT